MKILSAIAALSCLAFTSANASLLTIHDGAGTIGTVETTTGVATVSSTAAVFTDIAYAADGTLYAIDFENLYTVDPMTGATTLIGAHGVPGGNALVFGSDGTLYAHGFATTFVYSLNTTTGAGSAIGDTGYASAGDLAFVGDVLYLSTGTDDLITIDTTSGAGALVGAIGFANVYGLATDPSTNTLFGLTGLTLLSINAATGAGTALFDLSGQGFTSIFGTTFFGEAGEVPIPGAFLLMATALAGFGASRRKGVKN